MTPYITLSTKPNTAVTTLNTHFQHALWEELLSKSNFLLMLKCHLHFDGADEVFIFSKILNLLGSFLLKATYYYRKDQQI